MSAVYVNSRIFGKGDLSDKLFRAFTNGSSSMYLMHWWQDSTGSRRLGTPPWFNTGRSFRCFVNKLQRILDIAEGWHTSMEGCVDVLVPLAENHFSAGHMYVTSGGKLVLDDVVVKYLEGNHAESEKVNCCCL